MLIPEMNLTVNPSVTYHRAFVTSLARELHWVWLVETLF